VEEEAAVGKSHNVVRGNPPNFFFFPRDKQYGPLPALCFVGKGWNSIKILDGGWVQKPLQNRLTTIAVDAYVTPIIKDERDTLNISQLRKKNP